LLDVGYVQGFIESVNSLQKLQCDCGIVEITPQSCIYSERVWEGCVGHDVLVDVGLTCRISPWACEGPPQRLNLSSGISPSYSDCRTQTQTVQHIHTSIAEIASNFFCKLLETGRRYYGQFLTSHATNKNFCFLHLTILRVLIIKRETVVI